MRSARQDRDSLFLTRTQALRAYDAVQLASGLIANAQLIATGLSPLVFVSADNQLRIAALAEGLTVEDPNAYL